MLFLLIKLSQASRPWETLEAETYYNLFQIFNHSDEKSLILTQLVDHSDKNVYPSENELNRMPESCHIWRRLDSLPIPRKGFGRLTGDQLPTYLGSSSGVVKSAVTACTATHKRLIQPTIEWG